MDKLKEYMLRHKADLDVDSPASDGWGQIESKLSDESYETGMLTGPGFRARSGSAGGFSSVGRSRFSSRAVRYAAAACLIALAGGGLWLTIRNNKAPSATAKHDSGTIKSEPAPGNEKVETTLGKGEKSAGKETVAVTEEKTTDKGLVRNEATTRQARHHTSLAKPAELSSQIDIIDKSYSSLIDYQLKKLRTTPLYAENGSYFSFYVEQFKQMDQDEQSVRNDIKAYGLTNEFLEQLINVYQQKLNVLKNLQTEINKMNNKVREKQARSATPEIHYLDI